MKIIYPITIVVFILFSCSKQKRAEYLLKNFIKTHQGDIEQLHNGYASALWENYSQNNEPDAFYHTSDSIHRNFIQRAENELNFQSFYSNMSEYEFLKRLDRSGLVKEPLLKRQLNNLYNQYAWAGLDIYRLNEKQANLAKKFYALENSKPNVEDIQYLGTDSMLTYDLRRTKLIKDFKETVKEKNLAAQKAGYDNFWTYWLDKNEISNAEQEQLIVNIEGVTRDDYLQFKKVIDEIISIKKGIPKEEISYSDFYLFYHKLSYSKQWSQKIETDSIEEKLEAYFIKKGFKAKDIYANSNLWWSPEKLNGSFAVSINGKDDVRIYGNYKPTYASLLDLLHETGHALYFKSVDPDLPFILREPNLSLNEAMGFVFQSLMLMDEALYEYLDLEKPTSEYFNIRRPGMLFLTRDLLVRAELEKEIFRNPNQDINKLFWDLKKKYFFYDQTDCDKVPLWIQDRHIINNSGIYQAYLYAAAISGILMEDIKHKDLYGDWLTKHIFKHGNSMSWRDIQKNATGRDFSPDYISNLYR